MKYILALMFIIGSFTCVSGQVGFPDEEYIQEYEPKVEPEKVQIPIDTIDNTINITVFGQGVAPLFASSPAQAYALAKRAAMADAYRLLAEQVKGVRIDGKDTIKNMAIKSSVVSMRVNAMIKNAKILETTYKNGMCEVEMEVNINKRNFL